MADHDRRDSAPRADAPDTVRRGPDAPGPIRRVLDHPRLWRVTAALAALLLCALLLICSQGSLTILAHKPAADNQEATTTQDAAAAPSWEYWCTKGTPRKERERLAFCARVEGRVLASTHGPNPDESHIAVISDFHLVIVRLPNWEATPNRGAKIVAIGPLFRARDGQREVQAFRYETT
jgi:hypothetical protein